jgi:Na+/H+ antiporter NhaD/arsenite permease-like protein
VTNVGLLDDLATFLGNTGLSSPALYLAIFTWSAVLLSSFIDNVPFTVLMIPVCVSVAGQLGVSPLPFCFGMLVGTGIGGNLTPVGATANVIACSILERRGFKIRLRSYTAIALPFTFFSVLAVHLLIQFMWL